MSKTRTTGGSKRRGRWSCPLAALGLALAALPAAGQEEPGRHGIFLDTVDVHLINVEVIAVDSKGEPVTGLTREDFELLEDGEPREIVNFAAIEEGRRTAAPAADTPAPELAASLPEDQTFLALLVDNAHLGPTHRKAVFEQLRTELGRLLGPADRVMVVAQDESLTVEQPFTEDRTQIEAALERLERRPGGGAFNLTERDRILGEIQRGADAGGGGGGGGGGIGGGLSGDDPEADARDTLALVQVYANSARDRARRSMSMLHSFVGSLAGLPGRKAVLYVSDGIELSPGEMLFRVWDDKYGLLGPQIGVPSIEGEIAGYDATDELRKVIATANSNRVAFYTIDAAGNRAFTGVDAAGGGGFAVAGMAQREAANQQESLRFLAQGTGGVALLNNLNLGHLVDRLEKDFSSFYSLGFVSPHHGDGKYHTIKVRVRRPGVELRYLDGYRDKTLEDRMADRTLAALLLDVADNPLGIKVDLGEAVRDKEHYVVPVQVKIPLARLVLLPQEDAHLGQVSIFVVVRDEKGRMSAPQRIPVPIQIPNDQLLTAMTQVAGYTARLAMRPGEQKLAVGVVDELGAVQSTLNLNVDVGGGGR